MKSTITKKPKSSVELSVTVLASEMAEFFNQALKEVQKDFALEGFRKGNVPEDLILKNTGRQYIEAQSLDIAVQESYVTALKEHKLNPVAQPKIDIKKFKVVGGEERKENKEEIALEYLALIDILPEVEIRDYKNVKIKKDPKALEVTQSEIEKVFDHLRKQRAKLEPIDRPLKIGDWAEINFEGSLEGVARDDMKSNNYPIILGESQMIPGFEEQLIGLKKGDTKKFPIIFSKDYHQENFRKKRAEFEVTIIDTKERIIPEIDDKFIKDLGHDKLEDLSVAIKDSLKQEKETVAHTKLENDILAPVTGYVSQVFIAVGQKVELNQLMLIIG